MKGQGSKTVKVMLKCLHTESWLSNNNMHIHSALQFA